MSINDGGPAFPEVQSEQRGSNGEYWTETFSFGGMTLRDYFAGEALKPIMSACGQSLAEASMKQIDAIAKSSYLIADAMLRAREPS